MGTAVYNTMGRKLEELVPLEPNKVRMYACGITVYDEAHIGHASQAVFFDVIRRYLEYCGLEVTYVRNFTDIDDKIIKRAIETGRHARDVSEQYIAETRRDLAALKVAPATIEPKVTDHIVDIVRFIEELCEKGIAYESGGNVFFRVGSFPTYGKLSNRKVDELLDQEQVEGKERPADFTLWKRSKPNEPAWDSPWGKGRPGWHIECSALARKYLGDTLDIHGGGVDLVFPHHENEIAQSEALTGKPLSRYWLHNGLVMVDNQKMSKSLGNFYTIKDALKIHVPEVIRYIILSHHYSSSIDFSLDAFRNAEKRVYYFYRSLAAIDSYLEEHTSASVTPPTDGALANAFTTAMSENFNTAKVIAALSTAVVDANSLLGKKKSSDAQRSEQLRTFRSDIAKLSMVLGLLDEDPVLMMKTMKQRFLDRNGLSEQAVEESIQRRNAAKASKDFATADTIRGTLAEQGIKLLDLLNKTEWEIAGE